MTEKEQNKEEKWNVWGLEDDSSLSLLVHGSLQRSKSNSPPPPTPPAWYQLALHESN